MEKEEIKELIMLARKSIEAAIRRETFEVDEYYKVKYKEKRGVFTTILTYPDEELRGCIGFPYPIFELWQAVVLSAREAAISDPRFKPLTEEEYKNIIIELSILSKPELIKVEKPEDYLKEIKIGRDGLLIRYGPFSGLLLPQVPVEEGWGVEQFLDYTCLKAGLPPGFWRNPDVKVYRFTAEVWKEKEPFGDVERVL